MNKERDKNQSIMRIIIFGIIYLIVILGGLKFTWPLQWGGIPTSLGPSEIPYYEMLACFLFWIIINLIISIGLTFSIIFSNGKMRQIKTDTNSLNRYSRKAKTEFAISTVLFIICGFLVFNNISITYFGSQEKVNMLLNSISYSSLCYILLCIVFCLSFGSVVVAYKIKYFMNSGDEK